MMLTYLTDWTINEVAYYNETHLNTNKLEGARKSAYLRQVK